MDTAETLILVLSLVALPYPQFVCTYADGTWCLTQAFGYECQHTRGSGSMWPVLCVTWLNGNPNVQPSPCGRCRLTTSGMGKRIVVYQDGPKIHFRVLLPYIISGVEDENRAG